MHITNVHACVVYMYIYMYTKIIILFLVKIS